jgi:branched-chain amino acid transport system substrate-binding protein
LTPPCPKASLAPQRPNAVAMREEEMIQADSATRGRVCRIAVGFALIAAGAGLVPDALSQNQIKIGVLEPLSGPIAAEGRRQLNGMEVVREIINERGGISGKQLVWVVADVPDPTAASNEAARLITQESVKLLTGSFSSSLCVPASEVAACPASIRASTRAATSTCSARR